MSFTAVWAVFLPSVKQSIYFHKKKKVEDSNTMTQSTVTIYDPEKYQESQLSIEMPSSQQVIRTWIRRSTIRRH